MIMGPEYIKYLRASNGDGPAKTAFLSDDREVGDMSVITDNVVNWPAFFVATVGDVLPDDRVDVKSIFLGHLEGSIVMIDEFAPGYFDEPFTEGQTIFIKPASVWADVVSGSVEGVNDRLNDAVMLTGDQAIEGKKTFGDTVDISTGYALYNPTTQEQKVIDMTDAAAMRALKPGSYGVYNVNGATNVPGGVGVGGILEVKSVMLAGISNPFYSFTFTRVSSTPSNTSVWYAGCSTAATPLEWYPGGIGPMNKLPSANVDVTTLGAEKISPDVVWHFNASQVLHLTKPVLEQQTGIVLVWSRYVAPNAQNDSWNYTFIPKSHVVFNNGQGVTILLGDGSGSAQMRKYVYVSNTQVVGHTINGQSPNTNQVLRYAIGC